MYTTLTEVAIEALPKFLEVFTTHGAELRRRHGSRSAQVFEVSGDGLRVCVLIDWESREAFERFKADPQVPATMRSGGILHSPPFAALRRVASLPA